MVKVVDESNWSLTLPLGGKAVFRRQTLEADGPAELTAVNGKISRRQGTRLPGLPK